MRDTKLYEQLLGLERPWRVKDGNAFLFKGPQSPLHAADCGPSFFTCQASWQGPEEG